MNDCFDIDKEMWSALEPKTIRLKAYREEDELIERAKDCIEEY